MPSRFTFKLNGSLIDIEPYEPSDEGAPPHPRPFRCVFLHDRVCVLISGSILTRLADATSIRCRDILEEAAEIAKGAVDLRCESTGKIMSRSGWERLVRSSESEVIDLVAPVARSTPSTPSNEPGPAVVPIDMAATNPAWGPVNEEQDESRAGRTPRASRSFYGTLRCLFGTSL